MGMQYETLLQNWDVSEEQKRTDFLEYLYNLYECTDGLYTGLWRTFCLDIAVVTRDMILADSLECVNHAVGVGVVGEDRTSDIAGEPLADDLNHAIAYPR